jgi:hypothetical protein
MTDFTYSNEFNGITGTVDGSDFHSLFLNLESSINSKADTTGPESYTGTHTFVNITVTGDSTLANAVCTDLSCTNVPDLDGGTY